MNIVIHKQHRITETTPKCKVLKYVWKYQPNVKWFAIFVAITEIQLLLIIVHSCMIINCLGNTFNGSSSLQCLLLMNEISEDAVTYFVIRLTADTKFFV